MDYLEYISLRHAMSDELYHHGILGQKWGVRRYQNPDGTLTTAGRARMHKSLSKDKTVRIVAGSELYRTSRQKGSDANAGGKLYVDADEQEAEVYKQQIGMSNVMREGRAFVQKYIATSDLVIPSVKEQSKIERSLVDDADIRAEIVESLIKKGMTREQAEKEVKPIKKGAEFLKASPWLLMAPFNPMAAAIPFAQVKGKVNRQLDLIRVSVGDAENKKLNSEFERKLNEIGYNAYRDTNDRRALKTKQAIVITNPDKNTKLSSSHEMTKEEYGKAYANAKEYYNPKVYKNTSKSGYEKDGEQKFQKAKEDYIVNKDLKAQREEILKKHKKELGRT